MQNIGWFICIVCKTSTGAECSNYEYYSSAFKAWIADDDSEHIGEEYVKFLVARYKEKGMSYNMPITDCYYKTAFLGDV